MSGIVPVCLLVVTSMMLTSVALTAESPPLHAAAVTTAVAAFALALMNVRAAEKAEEGRR